MQDNVMTDNAVSLHTQCTPGYSVISLGSLIFTPSMWSRASTSQSSLALLIISYLIWAYYEHTRPGNAAAIQNLVKFQTMMNKLKLMLLRVVNVLPFQQHLTYVIRLVTLKCLNEVANIMAHVNTGPQPRHQESIDVTNSIPGTSVVKRLNKWRTVLTTSVLSQEEELQRLQLLSALSPIAWSGVLHASIWGCKREFASSIANTPHPTSTPHTHIHSYTNICPHYFLHHLAIHVKQHYSSTPRHLRAAQHQSSCCCCTVWFTVWRKGDLHNSQHHISISLPSSSSTASSSTSTFPSPAANELQLRDLAVESSRTVILWITPQLWCTQTMMSSYAI